VTYTNLKDHGTHNGQHAVLLPHEVFASLYTVQDVFSKVCIGPHPDDLVTYWARQASQPWVQNHPAFKDHHLPFQYAVPIGVHADKGQHISRDKVLNIAWGSCTSMEPTIWSKMLFTVCPDELLVKGVTDEQLYSVLVWSLHVMLLGKWPEQDHLGRPWPHGGRRWCMKGKPLSGLYRGVFSEYRGDWEWSAETFMWRSSCIN
jgi:hypothetical protein